MAARGEDRELTPKQAAFVQEYLIDLNATQAAIRAGYSEKNADKIGSELLGKTRIQTAIQAALKRRAKRTEITQDRVLRELAKLAFSDLRAFTEWGEAQGILLKDSVELEDDEAACVAEVAQIAGKDGRSLRFKLHSKEKALELLGKHLGLFTDKLDIAGSLDIVVKVPSGIKASPQQDPGNEDDEETT